jgi:fucose permease
MATFFLIIIYLSFISLGLPDSLLGVAWPVMQSDIKASFAGAGFISTTITCGTILSSLVSGTVIKRLGTGKVTFISCIMTAVSLLGFSYASSLFWLLFLAVPLGLGAGSVDAGLNNYVAAHYKARHMNWLHCFWGVGATIGPMIMSQFILRDNAWRSGYITVAELQFILAVLLFFTLPLWQKEENTTEKADSTDYAVKPLQIKGVKLALISFFFYCGTEATLGLWGSSFLVYIKGMSAAAAAQGVALFFAGITLGRLLAGFMTMKLSNISLIRMGQVVALCGGMLLLLPLNAICSLFGFALAGLGLAPIFPGMLHETPKRFGKTHAQKIMGYQMAVAYTGSAVLPPFLGLLAASFTMTILPFFILTYIAIMLACSEKLNILAYAKWAYAEKNCREDDFT